MRHADEAVGHGHEAVRHGKHADEEVTRLYTLGSEAVTPLYTLGASRALGSALRVPGPRTRGGLQGPWVLPSVSRALDSPGLGLLVSRLVGQERLEGQERAGGTWWLEGQQRAGGRVWGGRLPFQDCRGVRKATITVGLAGHEATFRVGLAG